MGAQGRFICFCGGPGPLGSHEFFVLNREIVFPWPQLSQDTIICFRNQIRIIDAPFNPFPRLRNITGDPAKEFDMG